MDFMALVDAHNEAIDMAAVTGSLRKDTIVKSSPSLQGSSVERTSSQSASTTRKKDPLKLIDEEESAKGRVSPKVYWVYITQVYGVALVVLLVLIQ
ncbi:unnamed protein product [Sphagnum jensenii]|jgi:hypothetical protein